MPLLYMPVAFSIIVSQHGWDFSLLELILALSEGGLSARLVTKVGVDEG